MLQSVWQWLKNLFSSLFGQTSTPTQKAQSATATSKAAIAPMDTTGYEYLWAQLLEGAANGWDRHRMAKFFTQVEDRCSPDEWFNWLEQFRQTVLASPKPNLELANRLELVATHVQYLPDYHQVALLANQICHELRQRATSDVVWEYDGRDR